MLVMTIIERITLGVVILITSGAAQAGEILLPSGPFEVQLPVEAICTRQAPKPNQDPPCVPAKADAGSDSTPNALDRAEGFMFHQKIQLAEAEIRAALEHNPASSRLWHFDARIHLAAGRQIQAREAIDKALALDPRDGDALATAAYLTSLSGQIRTALKDYERALALSPANQLALTQSVHLSEHLGDRATATRMTDRLIEHWPNHPLALDRAIDRDLQADNIPAAIAKAEKAANLDRSALPAQIRLVEILQLVGEHGRAVAALNQILGDDSDRPHFFIDQIVRAKLTLTRALSYKELQQFDEAQRDVEDTLNAADANLILRISVFLIGKGYDDLPVSTTLTPSLREAVIACVRNIACGKSLTQRI